MTDTAGTPGERLDGAIAAAKQAVTDLVAQITPKLAELGGQVSAAVDEVQARVDEIQAAWDARRSQ